MSSNDSLFQRSSGTSPHRLPPSAAPSSSSSAGGGPYVGYSNSNVGGPPSHHQHHPHPNPTSHQLSPQKHPQPQHHRHHHMLGNNPPPPQSHGMPPQRHHPSQQRHSMPQGAGAAASSLGESPSHGHRPPPQQYYQTGRLPGSASSGMTTNNNSSSGNSLSRSMGDYPSNSGSSSSHHRGSGLPPNAPSAPGPQRSSTTSGAPTSGDTRYGSGGRGVGTGSSGGSGGDGYGRSVGGQQGRRPRLLPQPGYPPHHHGPDRYTYPTDRDSLHQSSSGPSAPPTNQLDASGSSTTSHHPHLTHHPPHQHHLPPRPPHQDPAGRLLGGASGDGGAPRYQPNPHQQHGAPHRPVMMGRPQVGEGNQARIPPNVRNPTQNYSQALRVDTGGPMPGGIGVGGPGGRDMEKKEPAYNPQVEAISPTPSTNEDTKSELVTNISKMDKEITNTSNEINRLVKKQDKLVREAQCPRPDEDKSQDSGINGGTDGDSRPRSIGQVILQENRVRVNASVPELGFLVKKSPSSLACSGQPSDTSTYANNQATYTTRSAALQCVMKNRKQAQNSRDQKDGDLYERQSHAWIKKTDSKNLRKKAKDQKIRESYEKIFPELKKSREDKERFHRAGQRPGGARTEAELEQICDGLHEQEEEERKMRSYAIMPAPMLEGRERSHKFLSTGGRVDDPYQEHKARQDEKRTEWSSAEDSIFRDRFMQYPKNFPMIAASLERKNVADCVLYYYLTKKQMNYKMEVSRKNVNRTNKPKKTTKSAAPVREERDNRSEEANEDDEEDIEVARVTRSVAEAQEQGGAHQCCSCQSPLEHYGKSQPLNEGCCEMYGITQPNWRPSMRVCHACRANRRRCPVPSCPTPSGKIRRLRSLPTLWNDLSPNHKENIRAELGIPEELTKCCAACFNKIARLIGTHPTTNEPLVDLLPDGDGVDTPTIRWTNEETQAAIQAFSTHGLDWSALASTEFPSKHESEWRSFYHAYRKRYDLDSLLPASSGAQQQPGHQNEAEPDPSSSSLPTDSAASAGTAEGSNGSGQPPTPNSAFTQPASSELQGSSDGMDIEPPLPFSSLTSPEKEERKEIPSRTEGSNTEATCAASGPTCASSGLSERSRAGEKRGLSPESTSVSVEGNPAKQIRRAGPSEPIPTPVSTSSTGQPSGGGILGQVTLTQNEISTLNRSNITSNQMEKKEGGGGRGEKSDHMGGPAGANTDYDSSATLSADEDTACDQQDKGWLKIASTGHAGCDKPPPVSTGWADNRDPSRSRQAGETASVSDIIEFAIEAALNNKNPTRDGMGESDSSHPALRGRSPHPNAGGESHREASRTPDRGAFPSAPSADDMQPRNMSMKSSAGGGMDRTHVFLGASHGTNAEKGRGATPEQVAKPELSSGAGGPLYKGDPRNFGRTTMAAPTVGSGSGASGPVSSGLGGGGGGQSHLQPPPAHSHSSGTHTKSTVDHHHHHHQTVGEPHRSVDIRDAHGSHTRPVAMHGKGDRPAQYRNAPAGHAPQGSPRRDGTIPPPLVSSTISQSPAYPPTSHPSGGHAHAHKEYGRQTPGSVGSGGGGSITQGTPKSYHSPGVTAGLSSSGGASRFEPGSISKGTPNRSIENIASAVGRDGRKPTPTPPHSSASHLGHAGLYPGGRGPMNHREESVAMPTMSIKEEPMKSPLGPPVSLPAASAYFEALKQQQQQQQQQQAATAAASLYQPGLEHYIEYMKYVATAGGAGAVPGLSFPGPAAAMPFPGNPSLQADYITAMQLEAQAKARMGPSALSPLGMQSSGPAAGKPGPPLAAADLLTHPFLAAAAAAAADGRAQLGHPNFLMHGLPPGLLPVYPPTFPPGMAAALAANADQQRLLTTTASNLPPTSVGGKPGGAYTTSPSPHHRGPSHRTPEPPLRHPQHRPPPNQPGPSHGVGKGGKDSTPRPELLPYGGGGAKNSVFQEEIAALARQTTGLPPSHHSQHQQATSRRSILEQDGRLLENREFQQSLRPDHPLHHSQPHQPALYPGSGPGDRGRVGSVGARPGPAGHRRTPSNSPAIPRKGAEGGTDGNLQAVIGMTPNGGGERGSPRHLSHAMNLKRPSPGLDHRTDGGPSLSHTVSYGAPTDLRRPHNQVYQEDSRLRPASAGGPSKAATTLHHHHNQLGSVRPSSVEGPEHRASNAGRPSSVGLRPNSGFDGGSQRSDKSGAAVSQQLAGGASASPMFASKRMAELSSGASNGKEDVTSLLSASFEKDKPSQSMPKREDTAASLIDRIIRQHIGGQSSPTEESTPTSVIVPPPNKKLKLLEATANHHGPVTVSDGASNHSASPPPSSRPLTPTLWHATGGSSQPSKPVMTLKDCIENTIAQDYPEATAKSAAVEAGSPVKQGKVGVSSGITVGSPACPTQPAGKGPVGASGGRTTPATAPSGSTITTPPTSHRGPTSLSSTSPLASRLLSGQQPPPQTTGKSELARTYQGISSLLNSNAPPLPKIPPSNALMAMSPIEFMNNTIALAIRGADNESGGGLGGCSLSANHASRAMKSPTQLGSHTGPQAELRKGMSPTAGTSAAGGFPPMTKPSSSRPGSGNSGSGASSLTSVVPMSKPNETGRGAVSTAGTSGKVDLASSAGDATAGARVLPSAASGEQHVTIGETLANNYAGAPNTTVPSARSSGSIITGLVSQPPLAFASLGTAKPQSSSPAAIPPSTIKLSAGNATRAVACSESGGGEETASSSASLTLSSPMTESERLSTMAGKPTGSVPAVGEGTGGGGSIDMGGTTARRSVVDARVWQPPILNPAGGGSSVTSMPSFSTAASTTAPLSTSSSTLLHQPMSVVGSEHVSGPSATTTASGGGSVGTPSARPAKTPVSKSSASTPAARQSPVPVNSSRAKPAVATVPPTPSTASMPQQRSSQQRTSEGLGHLAPPSRPPYSLGRHPHPDPSMSYPPASSMFGAFSASQPGLLSMADGSAHLGLLGPQFLPGSHSYADPTARKAPQHSPSAVAVTSAPMSLAPYTLPSQQKSVGPGGNFAPRPTHIPVSGSMGPPFGMPPHSVGLIPPMSSAAAAAIMKGPGSLHPSIPRPPSTGSGNNLTPAGVRRSASPDDAHLYKRMRDNSPRPGSVEDGRSGPMGRSPKPPVTGPMPGGVGHLPPHLQQPFPHPLSMAYQMGMPGGPLYSYTGRPEVPLVRPPLSPRSAANAAFAMGSANMAAQQQLAAIAASGGAGMRGPHLSLPGMMHPGLLMPDPVAAYGRGFHMGAAGGNMGPTGPPPASYHAGPGLYEPVSDDDDSA